MSEDLYLLNEAKKQLKKRMIFSIILAILGLCWIVYGRISNYHSAYKASSMSDYISYAIVAGVLSAPIVIYVIKEGIKIGKKSTKHTAKVQDGKIQITSNRGLMIAFGLFVTVIMCIYLAEYFLIVTTVTRGIKTIRDSLNMKKINEEIEYLSNSASAEYDFSDKPITLIPKEMVKSLPYASKCPTIRLKWRDLNTYECENLGGVITKTKGGGQSMELIVRPLEPIEGYDEVSPYAFTFIAPDEENTYLWMDDDGDDRDAALFAYHEREASSRLSFQIITEQQYENYISDEQGGYIKLKFDDGKTHTVRKLASLPPDEELGFLRIVLVVADVDVEGIPAGSPIMFGTCVDSEGEYYISQIGDQKTIDYALGMYYEPDEDSELIKNIFEVDTQKTFELFGDDGNSYTFRSLGVILIKYRWWAVLQNAGKIEGAPDDAIIIFAIQNDRAIVEKDDEIINEVWEEYKRLADIE